jgi:DNA-binding NtrC family response regulator
MKDRIHVRVLIIDDDEAVCRRLSGWLEDQAYEVVTFTDPNGGVEQLRRAPCELALVDLRLPEVDGVDVIGRLREVSPGTPVVAMCAFPDHDQLQRALRAGARELLEKPIQRDALLTAVERQLAEIGIPARAESQFNRLLGARLRKLRLAGGRTQQEVADCAGITAAQLSQIELGKTATSTWTLARISGALRVTLGSVFDEL